MKENDVKFENFEIVGPIFPTVTMFKASDIRQWGHYKFKIFKNFDMFVVEVMNNLRKLFVPRRKFSGIVLFFNGQLCVFFFFFDR